MGCDYSPGTVMLQGWAKIISFFFTLPPSVTFLRMGRCLDRGSNREKMSLIMFENGKELFNQLIYKET